MQQGGEGLTYFAFDLLELDGEDIARLPLLERKKQFAALLRKAPAGIVYSDHEGGNGEIFRQAACKHGLEGIVSKRLDRPYLPGDRGAWVKTKCLNRAEFVVVDGRTPKDRDPMSARSCSVTTSGMDTIGSRSPKARISATSASNSFPSMSGRRPAKT
jgi:bifunctional non-homologous end joining protein LigD